jgi:two-component system, NarL family, sensor kinase
MTLSAQLARRRWWPALSAWLAWALWTLAMLGLVATGWLDHLLRQAGRPDLAQLNSGGVPPVLAIVSAVTAGAVLGSRRPRHPVGWLLLALGFSVTASGVADGYARYGLVARPGAVPAAREAAVLSPATLVTVFACIGFVLLLTPTGSLPSPRWRWSARVMVIAPLVFVVAMLLLPEPLDPRYRAVGNPLALHALGGALLVANQAALAVTVVAVVAAAGSLVGRFRRARGVERQQLRWVALAAALTGVMVLVVVAGMAVGATAVFLFAAGVCMALLPLATGAAILHYRLYDLDRIISRTLVYGLLTAGGIGLYVGVVRLVESLLRERVGLGGSLLATAVIAVAFAPARDRLQRLVDRRLYGERHDPIRAVVRLGERLRGTPGGPGGDGLAEVLQGVCEALRLPFASLHADEVQVACVGRPGEPSESIALQHGGQQVGALVVGVRSGEQTLGAADRRVLEVLAVPVAVALHALLLSQELQRSRERLVAAREDERRRLRRDLHDGLGAQLTGVTLKTDTARNLLHAGDRDRADALLAELRGDVRDAIDDIRRLVYALRPPQLDQLGLVAALHEQAVRLARGDVPLQIRIHAPNLPPLPAAVEVAAYRIATEAMTNAARHAHARQCQIHLHLDGALELEIIDDGVGLPSGWRAGVGVSSMQERAAEVGGTCLLEPATAATGTGTRVRAVLPLLPLERR